ncbi:MAG TPA: hypothetical protein PKK48_05650 [Phycisphaerae bacterium]|nr:hypothetical protein [Phycisphaerae bacterium]HPS53524.1 hypothetical protein [Phycisphaerae bacterium]
MKRRIKNVEKISGQMTVEWALLIAAFGLPMIAVFRLMLTALTGFYQMLTCVISLPLP